MLSQDNQVKIAWVGKHFGEEPPLSGSQSQGAGGIFFTGCNLRCVFCQNYQISQQELGQFYSVEQLAGMMLKLQADGAVNIDLVAPTIWWQQIKPAIILAKEKGLTLPIVWNSNSYEPVHILKALDGLIDVYLPDFKYGDDQVGYKYSGVKNYSAIAQAAIQEMFRQVGYLKIDADDLSRRGLIVRHLVLPNNVENSLKALEILAGIDTNIHISLMSQYFPIHRADQYPEINRQITAEEFQKVKDYFFELGFSSGWLQEEGSSEVLIPDFNKTKPFGRYTYKN